ncbi:MAG TPA: hypothetical protein VIM57_02120 [Luteolibacter sp.]
MKPLIPLACLAGGIAIGWFARPLISPAQSAVTAPIAAATASVAPTNSPAPEPAAVASPHATGRPVETEAGAAKKKADAMMQDQMKKQQDLMTKRLTDFQRKKFEARLAKLAVELNLSPEQQEKIRASMEERFSKMGGLFDFNSGTSEEKAQRAQEMSAMMKTDGLDEATAGLLSDTQKEQYAGFKDKERQSRIESRTLKDLGNVTNVIELSPEQRDAVYQVLADQAAEREQRSSNTAMMSAFTESMGVQIDDELGIQDLMQEQADSQMAGKKTRQADVRKTMRETLQQRVDAKAEALRPHLTDAQYQQYRNHLQTKASGMLSMFGQGEEDPGQ